MTQRTPRPLTGDPAVDEHLRSLIDLLAPTSNRDLLGEILTSVAHIAQEDHDRLDLKITSAVLGEMRSAFNVFRPYRDRPKVTMFGSARTQPDDPLYAQARDFAAHMAAHEWMVVTGAGPGIMAAGMEGAGRELSMGVNIRLPFEQGANAFIQDDPKLVQMKYFFTRKLMLVKESDGFVVLPGGFGTLDESFELLTLLQTGKAAPAPVVLLDVPGQSYYPGWKHFVEEIVMPRGLVSPADLALYTITDSVEVAAAEVLGFYRNYRSLRYVGERLVLRLKMAPTEEELALLADEFGDICVPGHPGFETVGPSPAERSARDDLDAARIAFTFDKLSLGRLRALIDRVNTLVSAEGSSQDHPPLP